MKTSLFLVGSVIILFGFAHSAFAMTSNITLTPPEFVDTFGKPISNFQVDQQIAVQSNLTNNGSSDQPITYLVQVMDSNGATDFLEGASLLGKGISPGQSFTEAKVWTPKHSGQYTVEIFVWSSLTSAIPLTDVLHTTVNVT
ncbi:MAG: hypothetical protein ACREA1_04010 [Nitrosotalea sp.]